MKRVQVSEDQVFGTALDRLAGGARAETEIARPEKIPSQQPSATMIKLSVFLNQEEDSYLEGLASAAKFGGGKKLSKTKLIQAMVRAFRGSQLDVTGVRDNEELLNRVITQLR